MKKLSDDLEIRLFTFEFVMRVSEKSVKTERILEEMQGRS